MTTNTTINEAIQEYSDSNLLQYLQEKIEEGGRDDKEEVMQMCSYYRNKFECTPLQLALQLDKSLVEEVYVIMDMGGRELVRKKDKYGRTALHYE